MHERFPPTLNLIPPLNQIMAGQPTSKILDADNESNDDDAILFSQALNNITNLRNLNLLWNNFTSVGVKVLFASLVDKTSLNAISNSNHTCRLHVFDNIVTEVARDIHCNLFSLNVNLTCRSKKLIALHEKESLLKYLADVPVGLMPDELAFVQRERDHIKSMGMIFAAMRWCNMPSLDSFHHCVLSSKRKRDD